VSVTIRSIATAVPSFSYTQEEAARVMLDALEPGSRAAKLVHRIYAHSGIGKRHSVIHDLRSPDGGLFIDGNGRFLSPTTGQRNDVYREAARPLFAEAAGKALDAATDVSAADVTHVITVSCTGFYAPGPDFHLVQDLGLRASTRRVHVGFMGCYAAFPALSMARAYVEADPSAVVLVVCLELCSLHLEPSEEVDDILAFSVFADGAAACIVTGGNDAPGLRLAALDSTVAPDSENDMAWTIGDKGFKMVLSTYVPRILEANVENVVAPVLARHGWAHESITHWAVHPGGRAILDKVRDGLHLAEDRLTSSRTVLNDFGNMSSATILFVLDHVMTHAAPGERVMAMAFGPGLTVETALLERC
jgi:predicted naringenin-chalcone synthase